MSFIPIWRMSLWFLIEKKRRLLCEYVFIPIERWTLILKNGGKGSFSYETKASILFIPIRKMHLWCPVMKRKKIIARIRVYPNWLMKFDPKKWWDVKFFLWNQSIYSFIRIRRISLWYPTMKTKEIVMWIRIYPN